MGANNIANVVGVFLPVAPFDEIVLFDTIAFSSAQQLFLLGGLAIGLGVFTYSRRVMETVGGGIFKLSPIMALVAVWSHSIVLFLFSSQGLETFLLGHGLPSIPLVPVSSSQAIVGAVIGMGLLKDGRNIRWRTVGGITCGWISTPLIAGIISFFCLFFVQNVFQQTVYNSHMDKNNMQIISHTQILTPNVKNIIIRNYSDDFVAQAVVAMSKITGKAEAQNVIKYEKVIRFCNIDTEP